MVLLYRDLHGLEPLLELLKSDYPVVQELALRSLELCTQDAENREALRELDGLEKLVEFVGVKVGDILSCYVMMIMMIYYDIAVGNIKCLEDTDVCYPKIGRYSGVDFRAVIIDCL